jgi:hypothetical protein
MEIFAQRKLVKCFAINTDYVKLIAVHKTLAQSEIDKIEVDKLDKERVTYAEALAAARENPDEEHLNIAAEARSRLQVLVL